MEGEIFISTTSLQKKFLQNLNPSSDSDRLASPIRDRKCIGHINNAHLVMSPSTMLSKLAVAEQRSLSSSVKSSRMCTASEQSTIGTSKQIFSINYKNLNMILLVLRHSRFSDQGGECYFIWIITLMTFPMFSIANTYNYWHLSYYNKIDTIITWVLHCMKRLSQFTRRIRSKRSTEWTKSIMSRSELTGHNSSSNNPTELSYSMPDEEENITA